MDKKSKWLSKVAEQHNEWIKIVKSFGEKHYYEDIVQEMYLVIYKYSSEDKIIKNGAVSRGYIFFTLGVFIFNIIILRKKLIKLVLTMMNFISKFQTIIKWMSK